MAFCKPSCQSFFSSRVLSFSPGNWYFHETLESNISFLSSFSQNQRWTKSVILWEGYIDWFAISRNSAWTCQNTRNDKCIASFRVEKCRRNFEEILMIFEIISGMSFRYYNEILRKLSENFTETSEKICIWVILE